MNRRAFPLLLGLAAALWFSVRALGATSFASAFDDANKLYEQGKFPEAAQVYQTLIQSGSASAAVCFNLGNAYYKSGEIGRAVAAYRQAEQLSPRDPDVRANLQFVRNQVPGPKLPVGDQTSWLRKLSVNEWTGLTSVSLWLCLVALTLIQFRPALKQSLRAFIWLSGTAALAFGICLAADLSETSTHFAIVTAKDAIVRNGPVEQSPVALNAHDGAEFMLLDYKDDWVQLSPDGRHIGWLKRDQVIIFPPDRDAVPRS